MKTSLITSMTIGVGTGIFSDSALASLSPSSVSDSIPHGKEWRANWSQKSSTWRSVPREASDSQDWRSTSISSSSSFPVKRITEKIGMRTRLAAAGAVATATATANAASPSAEIPRERADPECGTTGDRPSTSSLSFSCLGASTSPPEASALPHNFDMDSWRATRTQRKINRRRALAICLALAGFSNRGHTSSQLELEQPPPTDFIRLSWGTGGATAPTSATPKPSDYGDMVTVSTGSSVSSTDGKIKGLPNWMHGSYHLCMGDGFHVQVPADWQMQATQGELYGTVLRYVDNSDPSTNVAILKGPTTETQVGGQPDSEGWISKQASLLMGEQDPLQSDPEHDKSVAEVVNVSEPVYKQGLIYHNYEFVTQGEDYGEEVHELLSTVVNNGDLYLCLVRLSGNRWCESTQTTAQRIIDSFQITGFKIHN